MPELPEVETMVRGIRPHLQGHRIKAVVSCGCKCRNILIEPSLRQIQQRSAGQIVQAVTRRGKRILLHLQSSDVFVIEPRMTGLMLVGTPPNKTHLRLEWQCVANNRGVGTRNGNAGKFSADADSAAESVWFWDQRGLGTVRLLTADELEERLGPHVLGPDALEITPAVWQQRLAETDRPIKVALLDQKLVAGIGNLYASEILHAALIHPETPASRLNSEQIARMSAENLRILQTAIAYEGSTLSDGTYRTKLNQSGGYQNAHRVYDRDGEPCLQCKSGVIKRIVQAQRSTFYCPECQIHRPAVTSAKKAGIQPTGNTHGRTKPTIAEQNIVKTRTGGSSKKATRRPKR